MQNIFPITVVVFLFSFYHAQLMADEYDWVVGKWQLTYDPDGGETDYLEFMENGDVISRGAQGEIAGFYIAAHGMVKAVLTINDRDLILSFFHNKENTELRIVTSASGKESVYSKVD